MGISHGTPLRGKKMKQSEPDCGSLCYVYTLPDNAYTLKLPTMVLS